MKVLLIGFSGQLGNSIIKNKPQNINLITPNRSELDLKDGESCYEFIINTKPKWVINAGAYTSVDLAEKNPQICFKINAKAPEYIANALKKTGGNLIHISTDYVFDGNQKYPYKTNQKKNPLSVYGKSKSNGEDAIINELYNKKNFYILRTSWLIGPTGKNFTKTILNLHKKENDLRIISDQIGSPTSTISLSNIIWRIISKHSFICQSDNSNQILHWTDSGITSWYQLALKISEIGFKIGLIEEPKNIIPIKTTEYKLLAERPMYSVLDCETSENFLQFKRLNWEISLNRILESIKEKKYNQL